MSPELMKLREESDIVCKPLDLATPGKIDLQELAEIAKTLNESKKPMEVLKFLCIGDVMFLFSDKVNHFTFYEDISRTEKGKIQSAGRLKILSDGSNVWPTVFDYSTTLEGKGLLTQKESDEYKMGFMRESLGEDFTYELSLRS